MAPLRDWCRTLTLGNIVYFAYNSWDFELLNQADKESKKGSQELDKPKILIPA